MAAAFSSDTAASPSTISESSPLASSSSFSESFNLPIMVLVTSISSEMYTNCFSVSSTQVTCSPTTVFTSSIMSTASLVLSERLRTTTTISSVNLSVCSASFLISSATTAKPFPASPALAASMAAFSARRLVCPAIDLIMLLASSIFLAPSSVLTITSLTFMADSSTLAVVFIRSLIADIPFSLASYTPSEDWLSSTIDSSFALSASPMLCIALVPLCISSAWCIAPIEMPSTALVSSSEAFAVLFALSAISLDTS